MITEENEWELILKPIIMAKKRIAVTGCELIINRNGQLVNYEKFSKSELKFTTQISIENISGFIKEMENKFEVTGYDITKHEFLQKNKKGTDMQIIILILNISKE